MCRLPEDFRQPRQLAFCGIDELRALFGVWLRKQAGNGNFRETWIGVVALEVRVGQLHGFDSLVEFFPAERAARSGRELLHDVQHFERRHALAVGRQLVDTPSAVGDGDGLDPFRRKISEVLGGHRAAKFPRRRQDRFGNFTGVVGARTARREEAQGFGDIGIFEHLSGFGSFITLQENPPGLRIFFQLGFSGAVPVHANHFLDGKSVARVKDGGGKEFFPTHTPEACMQFVPSLDRARHGHRIDSFLGHLDYIFRFQVVNRELFGAHPLAFSP